MSIVEAVLNIKNDMVNTFGQVMTESVAAAQCMSKDSFLDCYQKTDALSLSFLLCLFFSLYCFVFSIVSMNASKVDQIWSVTPWVYAWHFYIHHSLKKPEEDHNRLLLVCVLVTWWGFRLTFNFWRRGGYGNLIHHEEDYRWPILRKMMSPFMFWVVFNITFIAFYQNLLLWLIIAPISEVANGSPSITTMDVVLAFIFVLLLAIESVADQQQWTFQNFKYSLTPEQRKKHGDRGIREGFCQSGLFYWSRHPNYFAEQAQWVVVYLFSLTGEQSHPYGLNWTVLGAFLLILLFQGSLSFSEGITLSKYPAYASYQKRTSQCIPFPPSADSDEIKNK